jgi:hypothetical protein
MSQAYDFIRDRLDDQIKYYSKQSVKNKRKYFTSQTIIIVLGIVIPIVNVIAFSNFSDPDLVKHFLLISTVLASIIGLTAALSQLNKHYETWLNFRSTLELLKREKSLYQNSAGGYFNLNEVDKKRIFVDRIEELLSSEHTKFFSSFQQQMDSLQYVKDILTKVNDLRSIDVTNNINSSNSGELTASPAAASPAAASPAAATTKKDEGTKK